MNFNEMSANTFSNKPAAVEYVTQDRSKPSETDLKIKAICERIEERHRKEKAEKALQQNYDKVLRDIHLNWCFKSIDIDGNLYYSMHPDRLITKEEYEVMAAFIVNDIKERSSYVKPHKKYKYSPGTIRNYLKYDKIQLGRTVYRKHTFLTHNVFFLCVISYLHKNFPKYKDIAEQYDRYIANAKRAVA